MLIERPPTIFRKLVPGGIFRHKPYEGRSVYLTFDDGPIPQATPLVLDILDRYSIKATFFMVGDNARRYPELAAEVRRRGHGIGNHTMHHLQGVKCTTSRYMRDVTEADTYLSTTLFRPPHGWLRPRQAKALAKRYKLIMYDLVTRDYSRHTTAADVVANVKRFAREGSIIVFHDSLKSLKKLPEALPASIEWLTAQGFKFEKIPTDE